MARRPRRNHSPAFKAKVAVTAIKGEKTLIELSQAFDIHSNQIIAEKVDFLSRPKSPENENPELVDRDDAIPF